MQLWLNKSADYHSAKNLFKTCRLFFIDDSKVFSLAISMISTSELTVEYFWCINHSNIWTATVESKPCIFIAKSACPLVLKFNVETSKPLFSCLRPLLALTCAFYKNKLLLCKAELVLASLQALARLSFQRSQEHSLCAVDNSYIVLYSKSQIRSSSLVTSQLFSHRLSSLIH